NLMLAKSLPEIVIGEPDIKVGNNGEFELEVEIENMGVLPTALLQAQLVKIVRPDMLHLDFPEGYVRMPRRGGGRSGRQQAEEEEPQETPKVEILEPESGSPSIDIDRLIGGEKKKVKFKIRLNGITETTATIRFESTRGGVITKDIMFESR
ncbi:hypothetical protein ACFL5L_05075, partial [candidate division KSB1 bacterium]